MKFLCDRCKTRYSIGDDRVRGKILKIRCKNCANVITVREGMTDADAGEPASRRNKTTTQAPIASTTESAPPPTGALGAAFASALTTKPPAALEEEWYVSNDGAQEGPFSLGEAQRWVGSKSIDADLHCWSEGFDDWLPVDKVSHFRGLRKKPAPAPAPMAPPPLPRGVTTSRAVSADEEPKPLFAATMASLEKSAPSVSSAGLGLPSPQPKTNGTANPIKSPAARPTPAPSVPAASTRPDSFAEEAPTAAMPPATAKRLAAEANAAFATAMGKSSATAPTTAKPAPAHLPTPAAPAAAAPAFRHANPQLPDDPDDSDDDLDIGEVSRVVNLADLMKPRSQPIATMTRTGSAPRINTGMVPRMGQTGAVPRLGQTGTVPRIDDPLVANGLAAGDASVDPGAVPAPVAAHHRRGMIMLLGVAVLLLAGVAIAVVLLVFGGDEITNTTLAGGDMIDTTRPDDPTRKLNPNLPGPGSATNPFLPSKPVKPRNPNPNANTTTVPVPNNPEIPTGSLRSDEIEDMARKHSTSTQRCYMRSQKGADLITMGDVKKIQATLTVANDGTVKDVTLSQHATTNLGKCLISAIKSWKFRTSPGGLYKISLQFVAG